LRFNAGHSEHDVRITKEFNDDYASRKPNVSLSRLKELLHAHGAVFVSSRGIVADLRSVNANPV
jgi:hypothetical protein